MSTHFTEAFQHILKWEGGDKFHKVPGDPGGATKYGVSLRAYRGVNPAATEQTIKDLTFGQAAAFARKHYWDAAFCGAYKSPLALVVFDHAYNRGPKPAIRLAQHCAAVLGFKYPSQMNAALTVETIQLLTKLRLEQYNGIVKRNTGLGKFLKGWTNRVMDTEKVAIDWLNKGML